MAWIAAGRLAELERKERELAEIRHRQFIQWVGDALGNALATELATRPFSKWTGHEKAALRAVCGTATDVLTAYIAHLPKDHPVAGG